MVLRGCRDLALQRMQEPEDREALYWNKGVLKNYAGYWRFWTYLKTQEQWDQL